MTSGYRSSLLAHQEEEHDDITCKKCGTVCTDNKDYVEHCKKCEEEEGREASQILDNMMTQVIVFFFLHFLFIVFMPMDLMLFL